MKLRVDPRILAAALPWSLLLRGGSGRPGAVEERRRGDSVTLNFANADIEGVTRAVGAIVKQQFVIDPAS